MERKISTYLCRRLGLQTKPKHLSNVWKEEQSPCPHQEPNLGIQGFSHWRGSALSGLQRGREGGISRL